MEVFFQWLIERWEAVYIWFLVRPYERAVQIRGGKVLRVVGPGQYWKLPFEFDAVIKVNIVTAPLDLRTQVVTDKNGQSWAISAQVQWAAREEAVERMVIELEDHEEILCGTIYGMLSQVCRESDMSDLASVEQSTATAVRRRLGPYGFVIRDLWITDVSKARTLRLVTGND